MVVEALLVCSDHVCAASFEARGRLPEVETLSCECGCALQVLGWPHPLTGRPARAMVLTLVALDS
jgi:hypothetical protein